ncbi:MAG: DNA primase large subunit PriL [Candidatus Thermoplasmatota archaeon]
MDLKVLCRHPFLKEARDWILSSKATLEDLVQGAPYGRARDRAYRRIIEALERGKVSPGAVVDETDAIVELYSYPLARMLVSCVADPYLISRYALAEGVGAGDSLRADDDALLLTACHDLGIDARPGFSVHIADFLRLSSQMRNPEWKLVNQDLRRGYVHLTKDKLARMVQQALQERIECEMPIPVSEMMIETFAPMTMRIREVLAEKRRELKPKETGEISILRMPPCMREFLKIIDGVGNLPHSARFALTSFLHYIGMSNEDILSVFSNSPDFDRAKAGYQIDHITGASSGVEYMPPECSTMKSYGICINPDELCAKEWMTHPLTYYRVKGKRRAKEGSARRAPPGEGR